MRHFAQKWSAHFPQKAVTWRFFQILRCIDDETFTNYIYQKAGKERPHSEHYEYVSFLYGWGLNEALSNFWPKSELPGLVKFETSDPLCRWADSSSMLRPPSTN